MNPSRLPWPLSLQWPLRRSVLSVASFSDAAAAATAPGANTAIPGTGTCTCTATCTATATATAAVTVRAAAAPAAGIATAAMGAAAMSTAGMSTAGRGTAGRGATGCGTAADTTAASAAAATATTATATTATTATVVGTSGPAADRPSSGPDARPGMGSAAFAGLRISRAVQPSRSLAARVPAIIRRSPCRLPDADAAPALNATLRRDPQDPQRVRISGRLSEVCATLDRLVARHEAGVTA